MVHEPSLRPLGDAEAWPMIVCIYAAGRVSQRLAAQDPPPAADGRRRSRRHPDPQKRLNDPQRDYGLTETELPEWRWLMKHKHLRSLDAANVVIRSRRAD